MTWTAPARVRVTNVFIDKSYFLYKKERKYTQRKNQLQ